MPSRSMLLEPGSVIRAEPLIPTIARILARNTARRLLVLADVDGAAPDVVERALDRAVAETAEQFHDEAREIMREVLNPAWGIARA